jgi:drug/metabolite transporter (DMT)-like permease
MRVSAFFPMTDRSAALFIEKPPSGLDDLSRSGLAVSAPPPRQVRAAVMLALATVFWGLSFPLAKALVIAQRGLLPEADSLFLAALGLVLRFGLAAAVLAVFSFKTLRALNRGEVWQGVGLGFFGGAGMLLQMDGLTYTAASTSAFLTACYCVVIPVIVAVQRRRWPSALVGVSCALVALGMSLLAGIDWRTLQLGRGEWETVLASMCFAGQILWLERPGFARNRTSHVTLVMFAALSLLLSPVIGLTARAPGDMAVAAWGSPVIVGLMLTLMVLCTLFTFTTMNHWQPHIEATQAGLIYCLEPVFASLFALFLPVRLAALAGIVYANETLTWQLLAGGALITAANIAIQWRKG